MLSKPVALFLLVILPAIAISQGIVQAGASSLYAPALKLSLSKGYQDVAGCKDVFFAVGNDGRIDHIDTTGRVTAISAITEADLNGVICRENTILAVGNKGTILISTDGQTFRKSDTGTENNINDLTVFRGLFFAAAEKGTLLVSENGETWKGIPIQLKGDLVSISGNDVFCMAVTNVGEIIKTTDGFIWDVFDFNSEYKGYYKQCSFRKVLVSGRRIVVIGQHAGGDRVVLFSSLGKVWTERSLDYANDPEVMSPKPSFPNDICYDAIGDQFFLACDNGEVLCLPSCSHCNKSMIVCENNLKGICCFGNSLMIVGDDFIVKPMKFR